MWFRLCHGRTGMHSVCTCMIIREIIRLQKWNSGVGEQLKMFSGTWNMYLSSQLTNFPLKQISPLSIHLFIYCTTKETKHLWRKKNENCHYIYHFFLIFTTLTESNLQWRILYPHQHHRPCVICYPTSWHRSLCWSRDTARVTETCLLFALLFISCDRSWSLRKCW